MEKFEQYQRAAARTIAPNMDRRSLMLHALHGIASEVGEIHGLHQKTYQGHPINEEHMKKEFGDLLWFIAEYCTALDWQLEEIAQMNIDKLLARYPDGFDAERSLHRKEGDV